MNYSEVDIAKYHFDDNFKDYITSYQNIYKNKILENSTKTVLIKKRKKLLEKREIKKILEDFFFTPKYDNVLDVLKFKQN